MNPHVSLILGQTSYATTYGTTENVGYERRYIDHEEGKIALDLVHPHNERPGSPVVLMIPGVCGASNSGSMLEAVYSLK